MFVEYSLKKFQNVYILHWNLMFNIFKQQYKFHRIFRYQNNVTKKINYIEISQFYTVKKLTDGLYSLQQLCPFAADVLSSNCYNVKRNNSLIQSASLTPFPNIRAWLHKSAFSRTRLILIFALDTSVDDTAVHVQLPITQHVSKLHGARGAFRTKLIKQLLLYFSFWLAFTFTFATRSPTRRLLSVFFALQLEKCRHENLK